MTSAKINIKAESRKKRAFFCEKKYFVKSGDIYKKKVVEKREKAVYLQQALRREFFLLNNPEKRQKTSGVSVGYQWGKGEAGAKKIR